MDRLCRSWGGATLAALGALVVACMTSTGAGDGAPESATSPDGAAPSPPLSVSDAGRISDAAADTSRPTSGASCEGGLTCAQGDCCESLLIPGGTFTFYRSNPAGTFTVTVSTFRLDKYEVTVGRFRKFVDAVVAGWTPPPGSGKHAHLAGGGIQRVPSPEAGWDPNWPALPRTTSDWDSQLGSDAGTGWTSTPGANETRPVTGETWYQAYAFCIWDGGFLPTEREWQYAYVGGDSQRSYPWQGTSLGCDNVAYQGCGGQLGDSVGLKPLGNARWGQADLAGGVREWLLDSASVGFDDPGDCTDCAALWPTTQRLWAGTVSQQPKDDYMSRPPVSGNQADSANQSFYGPGIRCARSP